MIFFKELWRFPENLKGGGQSSIFRRIPKLSFNTDIKIDESLKSGRFKEYSDYIKKLEKV
jgi:hypothetical protein